MLCRGSPVVPSHMSSIFTHHFLQAPSVQAQVEQHQRRVGRDRRRVLVPRVPVGGHRRGSGDIGVDVDLACGTADLVGLEAAAAGTQLDTL